MNEQGRRIDGFLSDLEETIEVMATGRAPALGKVKELIGFTMEYPALNAVAQELRWARWALENPEHQEEALKVESWQDRGCQLRSTADWLLS